MLGGYMTLPFPYKLSSDKFTMDPYKQINNINNLSYNVNNDCDEKIIDCQECKSEWNVTFNSNSLCDINNEYILKFTIINRITLEIHEIVTIATISQQNQCATILQNSPINGDIRLVESDWETNIDPESRATIGDVVYIRSDLSNQFNEIDKINLDSMTVAINLNDEIE